MIEELEQGKTIQENSYWQEDTLEKTYLGKIDRFKPTELSDVIDKLNEVIRKVNEISLKGE